jgi:hypothetical protein
MSIEITGSEGRTTTLFFVSFRPDRELRFFVNDAAVKMIDAGEWWWSGRKETTVGRPG